MGQEHLHDSGVRRPDDDGCPSKTPARLATTKTRKMLQRHTRLEREAERPELGGAHPHRLREVDCRPLCCSSVVATSSPRPPCWASQPAGLAEHRTAPCRMTMVRWRSAGADVDLGSTEQMHVASSLERLLASGGRLPSQVAARRAVGGGPEVAERMWSGGQLGSAVEEREEREEKKRKKKETKKI